MKTAVIYSSKTGNTKIIAGAILKVMPEGSLFSHVDNAPDPDEFDLIAMGYWVDKGTADKKARKYMKRINNKKVAIFATLGAYPDSDHANKSIAKGKALLAGNDILGHFLCQGKVAPKLVAMMRKFPLNIIHKMTPERKARIKEAEKHPNSNDCENAKKAFRKMIAELN